MTALKKYFTIIYMVASFSFGQTATITGKVLDASDGSPLMGANVVLEGTTQGAASSTDGQYSIFQVVPGDYTLMVSYIGYESLKMDVTVIGGETLSQDLELEPEAIQMETYVVTASRRRERVEDAPAAISVISKTEIRRESNTNLGDYLKGTKGIDFTQSGIDSYNMTARGFNSSFSSRLLTLTDGRMANVPSLRLTAYNVIPVSFEDVEQIEVVLGPASALYGPNAHSGVLNIVTSSPIRTQGTSVNIQGGLLSQTETDLLKKITFRTAHKYKDFGFKVSGVALAGQDWTHFNEDEYEGHDPAFIGRANFIHDNLDRGGSLADDSNPLFTTEMVNEVEGADESWVGLYWGDRIEQYGEEIGRAQIENSDIEHELQFTKKFISLAPLQDKLPDFTDLEKFLQVGWVIICNINSAALHWRPGYSGHFIVLCEVSADEVVLHDPGLPAQEYFRVSRASFQKAWAYPSEQDKNLLAIKKPA